MYVMFYGPLVARIGPRFSAVTQWTIWRLGVVTLLGGAALLGLGIVVAPHPTPAFVAKMLAGLLVAACCALWLALRFGRSWPLYLTESALGLAYAYLRVRTPWLDGLGEWDGVAALLLGLLCIGFERGLRSLRSGFGAVESRRMALALPLLSLVFFELGKPESSVAPALAAVFYACLARSDGQTLLGWLAGGFANLSLVSLWLSFGFTSPLFFALPAGATLGLLARIYDDQLGNAAPVVRTAAALIVFGVTSFEMFRFASPLPALALALAAIAAVLLGMLWRVRAYLYFGFASLLIDMVANLTRFGARDRLAGGLIGLAAGLLLLVLGIEVTRHKHLLLERYRRLQTWSW